MSYEETAWYVCDACGARREVAPGSPPPEGWGAAAPGHVCPTCAGRVARVVEGCAWGPGTSYAPGELASHGGALWRCLQAHESQDGWEPGEAPSLWARVIPQGEVAPGWERPDSTNPYMAGDRVTHGGREWVSAVDGNVWEPGAHGWEEA